MRKAITEAAVLIVLFFSTLFLLSKVDWFTVLHIEQITSKTEEKLGDTFWDVFKHTETESRNKFAINCIDSIIDRICLKNNFERDSIKLHILEKDEVNAFALPNRHLVVFSGLITECENPEELSGVLAHEIAHMEMNHVMKKLIKEIGLSMLISIGSGKSSGEVAKQAAKVLSSTAFDRSLEKEADMKAVDYMITANIDPEPFAGFMNRLSEKEGDALKYFAWVGTHPDSKERSEYILDYCRNKTIVKEPVLAEETWINLQGQFDKATLE